MVIITERIDMKMMEGSKLIASGRGPWSHIHGIATQNAQERGELLYLSQCVLRSHFRHGSLKIHIEHVLEVFCSAHVGVVNQPDRPIPVGSGLDLCQADVAEGECRQNFEQNARALVVGKHDAGLEWPVCARDDGLPCKHHETGHVPGVVLDAVGENLQSVKFRCTGAGDRRRVTKVVRRYVLGGAGRIIDSLASHVETQFGERVLTLG